MLQNVIGRLVRAGRKINFEVVLHTWGFALIGWLLALFVIVQFLRLPSLDLPHESPRWVNLHFENPECTAQWLADRGRDKAGPWGRHAGDQRRMVECVSAPFTLGDGQTLLIQYAGDPASQHVSIYLMDPEGQRPQLDLALGNAARHGWILSTTELPDKWRGKSAALVISDKSKRRFGWLVVRRLGQVAGASTHAGLSKIPVWLTVTTVVVLFLLAFVAMARGSSVMALPWLSLACAYLFLRFRAFYHWDDFSLLVRFVDGFEPGELLTYNGHLEPLFLGVYALLVAIFKDAYHYLQLLMLAGHVTVVILLHTCLRRHGFPKVWSAGVSVLYACSYCHADVVPWFLELSFMLSTALTILTVERAAAVVRGNDKALWAAVAASAAACLAFSGGLIAPWLGAVYLWLFGKNRFRSALVLVGVGVASAIMIALVLDPFSGTSVGGHDGRNFWELIEYWWRGAVQSSFFSLIGFRRNWDVGLVVCGIAVAGLVVGLVRIPDARRGLGAVLFGIVWLGAAYALQAVVRGSLGAGQSMSFRYTYHGMIAASFLLTGMSVVGSELVDKWQSGRRILATIAMVAMIPIVVDNGIRFINRTEEAEREFFELNRQEYLLTRAQLSLSPPEGSEMLDGQVLGSLHPSMRRREFVGIVGYLSGVEVPSPIQWIGGNEVHAGAGWLPALIGDE